MNTNLAIIKSAVVAICATMFLHAQAIAPEEIRFHNERNDTARITDILINECNLPDRGNVSRIARLFIDTPYKGGTLEGDSIETLTINLDEFDCTTFVESVLALAYTAGENRPSWHDYAFNLRRIRYRNGEPNGYASRLHYISDWIIDNSARGNIREITGDTPGVKYNVKTLDYMTSHRDAYPALADSTTFAALKNAESGFSNHRFPYLRGSSLKEKDLLTVIREGDIICFTTSTKGLDVSHVAIATLADGKILIIHASSKAGKVVVDSLPLVDYVKRNRSDGIRILRLRKD